MKRIIGLCMFCVGIGMAVYLLLPTTLKSVLITFVFIILGYYLFCCDN